MGAEKSNTTEINMGSIASEVTIMRAGCTIAYKTTRVPEIGKIGPT
jgi:hypothetical protein